MKSDQRVHALIWEYRVRPGHEREFQETYGPRGDWARLFAAAPGYLGTELLADPVDDRRYLTIDRWRDPESFARFKQDHSAAYAALDARCESWTEAETYLGAWEGTVWTFGHIGPQGTETT